MAGDFEDLKIDATEVAIRCFGDRKVRDKRFDIEGEAETAKELGIGDHGDGIRMAADGASVVALDAGGVPNVIDVAVGEEEKANFVAFVREPIGTFLRGVDENAVVGQEKAVGFEHPAGEASDHHSGG